MRKFVWNKFWNCLTIISLKRRGKSAETSFKIVLQCFRWSDEWIRLRQVLKLAYIIFVEAMRKCGENKFWNCLAMFSLKWWRVLAKTCFEIVLQCFRWSDKWIRLRQVLKLAYNIFVEAMRKLGSNKFWNFLTIFSLKWWRKPAKTCFEIVSQCFRWSDEGIRLTQVFRFS